MVVWKPIGRVEADWETMISNTPWKKDWNEGRNWQGKNRHIGKDLKGTIVGEIGDYVNEQISNGLWRWHINCTFTNNITKPHKDFGSPRFKRGADVEQVVRTEVHINLADFESDSAKELQQNSARFWVPMRDREFGQFFESESAGQILDWKAGDVFSIPVADFHAGSTVSFDSRYSMCLECEKIKLKDEFKKWL